MNNLVKLGVAGSLALGAIAAHASIVIPTSSGTTGDVLLFADVFNGTTLVNAYVGDTGVAVDSIGGGTLPTGTFLDSNLSTLLASATAGTTVIWTLEGGFGHTGAKPYIVSTASALQVATNKNLPFGNQTGSTMTTGATAFANQLGNVNLLINGSATSLVVNNDSQASGTGFNPFNLGTDINNWYGMTTGTATNGLGSATLYLMSAAGQAVSNTASQSALFTANLSSSGLSFSSLSVPLPASLWLLGGGLLGFAGVMRRKSAAA